MSPELTDMLVMFLRSKANEFVLVTSSSLGVILVVSSTAKSHVAFNSMFGDSSSISTHFPM